MVRGVHIAFITGFLMIILRTCTSLRSEELLAGPPSSPSPTRPAPRGEGGHRQSGGCLLWRGADARRGLCRCPSKQGQALDGKQGGDRDEGQRILLGQAQHPENVNLAPHKTPHLHLFLFSIYSNPPLSMGDTFQGPQWIPETPERGEPYICYVFPVLTGR